MAGEEPLLRDLRHDDHYQVIDPETPLPKIAGIFAKKPNDALLVYNRKEDIFIGVVYLYDFHKAYGQPPKGVAAIHKATVAEIVNPNLASINWNSNISQTWALVNKLKPKALLLHDDEKEFAGFFSNEDLWEGMASIGKKVV